MSAFTTKSPSSPATICRSRRRSSKPGGGQILVPGQIIWLISRKSTRKLKKTRFFPSKYKGALQMFDPILETKGKFDQHWWGPLLSRDHEHQAAETVHHSKQETSPTEAKDSTGKSTKDHGNNEKSGCTNPTIAGKFNQRRYSCSQKYH